jgi:toxic protein SymE
MATRNTKQIKLQPKHREQSGGQKIVPWLNVSGVWLEELGFKVGDTVSITTREKLLIIEPLEGKAKAENEYRTALSEVKQTLKKLAR